MSNATSISVRNLYKIFGANPKQALEHVRSGMSKPDLMSQHRHVLGLQDINVDMQSGEITVIMGLSGSGKSTLIRHFNRLIEPTAGEIIIDGENVLTYDEDRLRDMRRTKMSMVFQHFALLPHRTVLDNAGMAQAVRGILKSTYENDAKTWLDRVGLGVHGHQYPHQLSGGMQQRVGIARALTSNAPIMLMDEAFSALDPLIRTDMQDLLLELQKELHKTIVFISHDLDEAMKLADHLVILKDGAIVQQGEPQEILLHPNDPYIVDFISDINRGRVLRARSIMRTGNVDNLGDICGQVDADATLESVLSKSKGDPTAVYDVIKDGTQIGLLSMTDLIVALVPTEASQDGMRRSAT